MKLNNSPEWDHRYSTLEGVAGLRFELFDWLKEKGLSARQAQDLLSLTKEAIHEAYRAESRKIML